MSTFTIRPARREELGLLGAIEHDAAQLYREVGYDFCAEGPVRDDEELAKAFDEGAVFVACGEDGMVAGFALVWPADGRAHLLELAVGHGHQGHGLGRRLIAAAEDWARDTGLDEITLTTYRDVAWNAPFYERFGYEVFEPEAARADLAAIIREEADSGYAVEPRVAMRKPLRGSDG